MLSALRILAWLTIICVMTGSGVLATPVRNTSVNPDDWSGSRSIGSGLAGTGAWGTSFSISWEITEDTPGTLLYTYTFTWPPGAPSHVIFELSEGCASAEAMCVWGFEYNQGAPGQIEWGTWSQSGSNPNMPGTIYGVKVNLPDVSGGSAVLQFYSNRAPVWGNFYAKNGRAGGDGDWNAVWNVGLANLDSTDITDFIARPDTVLTPPPEIREPGTMALLGAGLVALGLIRRRG